MDRELIIAALRYRSYALFKTLNDSQIFAVTLPDGAIGYCCCMGNGGEHYSLALYRGAGGFATYLNTLESPGPDPIEQFERMCTFHALNCDFENAADCLTEKKDREEIKRIAAEAGIRICRPKGWPDFFVMDGAVQYEGMPSEQDRRDMTLALNAGCEVAEKIKGLSKAQLSDLGFADFYPSTDVRKEIPLLTPQPDGTWLWSRTLTPPMPEEEVVAPEFDDPAVAFKIKALRHRGIFQCRALHFPAPVGDSRRRYFPIELLTVDKLNGELPFMPEVMEESEDWEFDMLDKFAVQIIESGKCPASIETNDDRTYYLLQDFCEKTGIKLHLTTRLSQLREFWQYMFTMVQ